MHTSAVPAAGTWGSSSQQNRRKRFGVTKPCAGMAATAQWHAVPAWCKGLVPVLSVVLANAAPPQPTHRVALMKKPCSTCDATLHAKVGTARCKFSSLLDDLRKELLVRVRREK